MQFSPLFASPYGPISEAQAPQTASNSLSIPSQAPSGAAVVAKDLISLSIEFRHLPKFTGNISHPNYFSRNLLQNLKDATGSFPLVRVGGSSQDDAFYNSTQKEAEVDLPTPPDAQYPPASCGASFFDSYTLWPDVQFTAGINLASNDSESLEKFTELSCKALGSRLVMWEVGNEPDFYENFKRRKPGTWNIDDYVETWQGHSAAVQEQAAKTCPSLADTGFYGPSIGTVSSSPDSFTDVAAFAKGINKNSKTQIKQISTHSYMGIADSNTSPSILQRNLMNHTAVMHHIGNYVSLRSALSKYGDLPFTIGEGNSLAGGGAGGISDTFGAALWVVDYALYIASVGIKRVHFHQSDSAPYNAWIPGHGSELPVKTCAPYYGKLLAARLIGIEDGIQVINPDIPGTDGLESMYVAYDSSGPKRIAILNMKQWNSVDTGTRPTRKYTVELPADGNWNVSAHWLQAKGAELKDGITFGGDSYDFDADHGKPAVAKDDVKAADTGVTIDGNKLTVELDDSEGVLLDLTDGGGYIAKTPSTT
ncbi:hypothetical protein NA57DRAFT_48911 [Rhizodiscina lignyota]|uniref:Beta-glucuronidase C-terminal domain-containing protein n=1 Tax=Rhizodiscina lignyota TaxID=1504668 RepID=A0A9P4I7E4_9PEZI|nr:hypothetical protein NA57DRAFT_48911 [Rhizodiscina lignyota]